MLSPSYSVSHEAFEKSDELIERLDNETASLVQKYPDKLIGLCGVSIYHSDLDKVVANCLQHKGMRGLKIRLGEVDDTKEIEVFFNKVSLLADKYRVQIVLIHMPHECGYIRQFQSVHSKGEIAEIHKRDLINFNNFLKLVNQRKNTQFVIAHSAYSPQIISVLAGKIRRQSINNLWIETSTAFSSMVPYDAKEPNGMSTFEAYVNSWREFGVERIIFGSDIMVGDGLDSLFGASGDDYSVENAVGFFTKQKQLILENRFLTDGEKQKILYSNSLRLLNLIGFKE